MRSLASARPGSKVEEDFTGSAVEGVEVSPVRGGFSSRCLVSD